MQRRRPRPRATRSRCRTAPGSGRSDGLARPFDFEQWLPSEARRRRDRRARTSRIGADLGRRSAWRCTGRRPAPRCGRRARTRRSMSCSTSSIETAPFMAQQHPQSRRLAVLDPHPGHRLVEQQQLRPAGEGDRDLSWRRCSLWLTSAGGSARTGRRGRPVPAAPGRWRRGAHHRARR